jgi:biofilm PGA synthesis protein PgaA
MSFSDDNRRDALFARYEQGLLAKGDWRMRGMLDLYTSRNSIDTAPYFNPESDFSLSVTHLTEQILRRSRHNSHLHRLYTTLGIYKQSGFSNGLIGSLQYEHEYEFSDVRTLLLGAALARNVYDGEGLNSYTLSLNYTGRF